MTRTVRVMLYLVLAGVGLGCETSDFEPAKADTTYGTPVDASTAIPARAVLERGDALAGRRLVVDGRIGDVAPDGCSFDIADADDRRLMVEAARRPDGACRWTVPADAAGIVSAMGTLRIRGDTVRLRATGVRLTPFRTIRTAE